MKRLLLFLALLVFPVTAGAQLSTSVERGLNKIVDPAGRAPYIPEYTVATLPAKPSRRSLLAVVTDGSSASDCTVGGGATRVICIWNGSAFVTTSAATAPGGSTMQVQFNDNNVLGGDSSFTYDKTEKAVHITSTVGHAVSFLAGAINADLTLNGNGANSYAGGVFTSHITEDATENNSQADALILRSTTNAIEANTHIQNIGIDSKVKTIGTNNFIDAQALVGEASFVTHEGSGTINGIYGKRIEVVSASGAVTTLNILRLSAAALGGVQTAYGINIVNDLGGGTSESAAIKIVDQSTGANDYAIKTGLGLVSLGDKLQVNGHIEFTGTSPIVSNTSAASCGTTAATLVGKDGAGKVTVGATSGTSCTITFNQTWTNAPSCVVTNETTANLARATSTTSTVILAGTFVGGDVLAYSCIGWK